MITSDNLTEVLNDLSEEQINEAFEASHDWVLLWVHISNAGFSATIESKDYDEETNQEAADNGQLFCDKDQFLQLVSESETTNETLLELIK